MLFVVVSLTGLSPVRSLLALIENMASCSMASRMAWEMAMANEIGPFAGVDLTVVVPRRQPQPRLQMRRPRCLDQDSKPGLMREKRVREVDLFGDE